MQTLVFREVTTYELVSGRRTDDLEMRVPVSGDRDDVASNDLEAMRAPEQSHSRKATELVSKMLCGLSTLEASLRRTQARYTVSW